MQMQNQIPVIETSRLRLRGHTPQDFSASFAMWSDPALTRFIGPPSSESQAWSRILTYVGHWSLMGYGYWLVEERATGAFVGELGFADFRRDIDPPILNTPEAGWALVPAMHGKGYATEALRAALSWASDHLRSKQTVCIISPENVASIHLASKCGYRRSCEAMFKGEEVILFAR